MKLNVGRVTVEVELEKAIRSISLVRYGLPLDSIMVLPG